MIRLPAKTPRPPTRKTGAPATAALRARPRRTKSGLGAQRAADLIVKSLEDDKAEEIVTIDIAGRSSVADMLVIASGRSQRHVAALADHVIDALKTAGASAPRVEGLPHADWVVVDAGDVIVHLFRPEVRAFYAIEKIWSVPAAPRAAQA